MLSVSSGAVFKMQSFESFQDSPIARITDKCLGCHRYRIEGGGEAELKLAEISVGEDKSSYLNKC